MTLRQVDQALADFVSVTRLVDVHFVWRPQLSDANDEMVLDAAINGRAHWLVTHNLSDFRLAARRFGVEAIRPGDLVRRLSR